jgi:hypothetical protein
MHVATGLSAAYSQTTYRTAMSLLAPTALRQVPEVQVLLVGQILVRRDVRVVSHVAVRKQLVTALVRDGECESEQEDDDDFGDAGGHADDDPGGVGRGFALEESVRADNVPDTDADDYSGSANMVLVRQEQALQMSPETRSFLVLPPVLLVIIDRLRENVALEAPVKSGMVRIGSTAG